MKEVTMFKVKEFIGWNETTKAPIFIIWPATWELLQNVEDAITRHCDIKGTNPDKFTITPVTRYR